MVVLLHSFLMDVTMWAPQVEAFGQHHRLIAIDERGRTPNWSRVEPERLRFISNALISRDGILDRVGAKAEALVAALPEAELAIIDGGAHFLSLTHAADVNPHLERFLSACL